MFANRISALPLAMLALALCGGGLYATTPASPLVPTFTPTGAVSLSYQLPGTPGSSTGVSLATAAVATAPATSTFYTIDPTTVPFWLSVSVSTGTVVSPITAGTVVGTPSTFSLVASGVAASLGAGIYNATVQVDVIGFLPLNIPVTLLVKAPAATLTATGGTALGAETWAVGSTQVPFTFTLASNSVPISYTTTLSSLASTGTTVASGISITPTSGLVYTWGTLLSVTLSPLVYAEAHAGDVLTATVTVNYEGTTMPIALQLTVTPPVAAITSLYPTATPVDTTSTDVVNVVISGTGFVSSGTGQITQVWANATTQLTTGTGLVVNVVNSTTITLAITVGTTAYFSAAGTPLTLAVINPNGGTPAAPTTGSGVANLAVVNVPIINSVTSASTFLQSGSSATFAPYDMITIFGTNICPDCGGSNPALLTGVPDSTYFRYPTSLSPDPGTGQHYLQVQFNKHSNQTLVAQGYLIFANNSQINVLVPALLATTSGLVGSGTVDIVVSYGVTAPPTVPLSTEMSTAYTVGVAAADPGVLTVTSDGLGQGAILNSDFSLNSSSNAALHTTGTVLVYVTGLGAPTSTASNATTAVALGYPASCISALGASGTPAVIGYMTTINTTTTSPAYTAPTPAWTSVDGAVIQSAVIVGSGVSHYPPCNSPVTATIAGVAATVTYAGWVANSVAGLYQVNLTVPAGAVPGTYPSAGGTPISVPVLITVGGKTSQTGVTLYVK
ncbi:MAG TPA: hypothetical protein VK708_14810 [Bryobacteraceae bacterium]|jgi:uncharacterized protein (TIGR03437 family)|nr:hypothetical protein [Bryobacteraceae bacterium]